MKASLQREPTRLSLLVALENKQHILDHQIILVLDLKDIKPTLNYLYFIFIVACLVSLLVNKLMHAGLIFF